MYINPVDTLNAVWESAAKFVGVPHKIFCVEKAKELQLVLKELHEAGFEHEIALSFETNEHKNVDIDGGVLRHFYYIPCVNDSEVSSHEVNDSVKDFTKTIFEILGIEEKTKPWEVFFEKIQKIFQEFENVIATGRETVFRVETNEYTVQISVDIGGASTKI